MAYGLQPTHEYVKFVRGTKVAFDALLNKPDDTLFFIYENIEDNKGTLYLGDKKIGDGGAESLSDLITETVQDGELLVYTQPEGQEGHWEALPIEDIIGNMTGATASNAGLSGLVPAPAAGDENKFLRGDGTWAAVEGETFSIDENHITRVFVKPKHQNKGIGTMIFEAFEKIIFENFDTIQLDSSLAAINMYIKRGYETICHETTDCENGSILVYEVMEKKK